MLRSAVGPLGTSQVHEAVQVRNTGEDDIRQDALVDARLRFFTSEDVWPRSSKSHFDISGAKNGFIHQLPWTSAGFEGHRSASGATQNRGSSRLGGRSTAARQPVRLGGPKRINMVQSWKTHACESVGYPLRI